MKKQILSVIVVLIMLSSFAFVGGQDSTSSITLTFDNLADPGDDHYEGWLIVDGEAKSTGKFDLHDGEITDLDGDAITSFGLDYDASEASKFVLTLEPSGDDDTVPAAIKPVAGELSGNSADLSHNIGVDLSSVSGSYILATPTDGPDTNENSGIWWLDPTGGSPAVSLDLPDLSGTDWIYEGWVVIDGTPVTSGTFDSPDAADDSAPYSGDEGAPPFPGEDYLNSAPEGLTFPADLAGGKAVISIEPRMDNSPAPFQFKPLAGDIPTDATDHTLYNVDDMSDTLPTGTMTISEDSGNGFLPFSGIFIFSAALAVSALLLRRRIQS